MTALLWLTRDLRLHDHPALAAALEEHDRVVPVFCLDQRLLDGRHASAPRTRFMLECLADLDRGLRARGSALVVRHGAPERVLPALAREVGASAVHCSADSGPFARRRANGLRAALESAGVRLAAHPGLHAIDDLAGVTTAAGRPYTVFSPFHRAWERMPRRAVVPAPAELHPLPAALDTGTVPSGGPALDMRGAPRGGEEVARSRAFEFLADGVRR